jgi:hypothetical protein
MKAPDHLILRGLFLGPLLHESCYFLLFSHSFESLQVYGGKLACLSSLIYRYPASRFLIYEPVFFSSGVGGAGLT